MLMLRKPLMPVRGMQEELARLPPCASHLPFSPPWLSQIKLSKSVEKVRGYYNPSNLKLCQRGEWQDRMLVETVLSMLTLVCHFKQVMHRGWAYFQARLAFTMAAFNVLVQWHGLQPNASGSVPLSIAEFSL